MHDCPHCNRPGITTFRRLTLGPAIPATCSQCGGKIGVSYQKSFWALLPFLAGLFVGKSIRTTWLAIAFAVLGAAVMLVLWFKLVPLEKR